MVNTDLYSLPEIDLIYKFDLNVFNEGIRPDGTLGRWYKVYKAASDRFGEGKTIRDATIDLFNKYK